MRFRALAALLAASTLAVPAVLAHEPPSPNLAGAGASCEQSPAGAPDDESFNGRFCRNVAEVARLRGDLCREVEDDDPCGYLDGRSITEKSVEEYEASWVHRAMDAQRALDDNVPLAEALWPHTHNSYNSSWYPMRIANSDPNQRYSMSQQLRMDMRILELDVHWHAGQVVLCHGEPVSARVTTVHAGCSADRTLAEGLAEIRGWLGANPNEVIGIYLENALDDEPAAYEAAVAALRSELGALVYRPRNGECDALPATTVTRKDVRDSGARVFLVGNRDREMGPWCEWVHERDQTSTWWESGSDFGSDFPAYPECVGYLADPKRAGSRPWTRVYEDATWLSQMAGGGGEVTALEVERMVTCGVTMPGFDNLDPHDEGRLGALVWSWAPGEPAASGCAYQGTDARLHSDDCKQPRRVACLTAGGDWIVAKKRASWDRASSTCGRAGATFAAPWNGRENRRLADAAAGDAVWVAHRT